MFIFSKTKTTILNTETIAKIYDNDNDIIATFISDEVPFQLGYYGNRARVQEVLRQLFSAMANGDATFEMPD